MKNTLTILSLGVVLLCPIAARAAGADDKAAAQALFDEGRKLVDAGKYAEACAKLESSQRLDPGAGTLLWLATCYEKNGQTASAWVTYTDAATASHDRHPDWATRASERAKALFPQLSHLSIEIPNAPSGVSVVRDSKPLDSGSLGTAMPIDPGHHVIDATAPDKLPFHGEVDVARGANAHVTVTFVAAPVTKPVVVVEQHPSNVAPAMVSDGRGNGMRVAGLTTALVGAAGLIVGGVFGGLAIGDKNSALSNGNCLPDLSRCNATGKASVDDAMTLATVSTVAFIAGGVLAAAGITIFILAPASKEHAVAARVSPFGVSIEGEF